MRAAIVNISPIASGRLERTARTLFGSLLKRPERGNSPILAAPLAELFDSDNGGGLESKRITSFFFFFVWFLLVRVLVLLSWGARSWDLNWGIRIGVLEFRVLEGFKGERFRGWNARESILRGVGFWERGEDWRVGASSLGKIEKRREDCWWVLDKIGVKHFCFSWK